LTLIVLSNGAESNKRKTAKQGTKKTTGPLITDKAWLEVAIPSVDGKQINETGIITIGLYGKRTPIAATNFRALCTGENGTRKVLSSDFPLHYKGTKFHRVSEDWMIQGGLIGFKGEGIYGPQFPMEPYVAKSKPGLVAMAKEKKKNNGSMFFILLKEAPWTEKEHTFFGEVISGMDLVRKISALGLSTMGQVPVPIIDSGVF